jgi:hypothetical protein
MWDWSSFVSGVIGAVLGGGVTLGLAIITRGDAQRATRIEHTKSLIDTFERLAIGRRSADQVSRTEFSGDTALLVNAVNRAIADLSMAAPRRRDLHVVGWASIVVDQILLIEDDWDRTTFVNMLAIDLTQWAVGRAKPRAFKRRSEEFLEHLHPAHAGGGN